jgi:hypothetical protein
MDFKRLGFGALIFAAAFIILTFGYSYIKGKKVSSSEEFSDVESILSQHWESRAIGDTELIVYVPDELKSLNIVLDENARKAFKGYQSFQYNSSSFGIRINYIVLHEKQENQAQRYAEELAKALDNTPEFGEYHYEIYPITKEGLKGSFLTGSTVRNGTHIEIASTVVEKDNILWDIAVSFDKDSKELTALAEKVFESIEVR